MSKSINNVQCAMNKEQLTIRNYQCAIRNEQLTSSQVDELTSILVNPSTI